MSLLLEALKKAELAKQGSQSEPASSAEEPAPEPTPFPMVDLSLEEPEEPRPPVITRESLPDISQPLEIRSEDIAAHRRTEPRTETPLRAEAEQTFSMEALQPDPQPRPSIGAAEHAKPTERDAARQMFDVKEVDYNPRRPFYLTVGSLIAAGVCYGVYVWWQMQPRYSVSSASTRSAPPAPSAPAPVVTNAPPAPPPPEIPAAAPEAPHPAADPNAAPARRAAQPRRAPTAADPVPGDVAASPKPLFLATQMGTAANPPAAAATSRNARTAEPGPIAVTPPGAQADPGLDRAYSAYQRGSLDAARGDYQRVLERDPMNRDALLGLAAIDVRARSFETAELRYLKLLEMNPRDTYAHGALIALQGSVDPVQSESRVKTLIAGQPDATHLYFTLGNLYAAQKRWREAQDAFFKAYSGEPDNPDYAFNLAVSLDQLHQRRLAAEHYRKAVAFAGSRPAAFDRALAEARARELER
jgi:tetratricopeptide (TPR) repeat protein